MIDIVDLLPIGVAQKKFLLVTINYFNKWVKIKAYDNRKDKDVFKFVCKNIVCWFKIQQAIITDNEPQFDSVVFRTFCSELNIKNLYSTPWYPQNNRQEETTNKTLLNALRKRLEGAKRKWVDELLGILWAYRTTSRRSMKTTPFILAYGMEAIILTKIGMPTAKIAVQDQMDNNEELIRQLDWADEMRGDETIWITSYHQRTITQYKKGAEPWFFRLEYLVLKRIFENIVEVGSEKVQANWEGLYVVTKAGYSWAYHLQTLNDVPLVRPWNVTNLKQFYQ